MFHPPDNIFVEMQAVSLAGARDMNKSLVRPRGAVGVDIHFQYHPPRKPEPASPRHPMLKVFVSFTLPSML